jgi:sulfite reductase alpha subunit-like flavoprotein
MQQPHACNPAHRSAPPPPRRQDVAEGIAREARLMLFEPRVLAMDAYPAAGLPGEAAVVFVASTTGQVSVWRRCAVVIFSMNSHRSIRRSTNPNHPPQKPNQGDPPDNMRRFWRFLLRKSLAADSLAATRYAVFGLGDSAYVKFNVST